MRMLRRLEVVKRALSCNNSLKVLSRKSTLSTQRRMSTQDINYLRLDNDKKLAYEKTGDFGGQKPTIIYVPGFMSGKDGDKARHMRQFCSEQSLPYVR